MTHQFYTVFETPSGFCGLAWSDVGVTRFQLPMANAEAAERHFRKRLPPGAVSAEPPDDIRDLIADVRRYFAGEAVDFGAVRLDLDISDEFFKKIYSTIRRLGWGETTTYGAVAMQLDAGRQGARDVGQAMANNPVPLIIPCHRVLAAGQKLGGFSAPGGSASKARMLELEGVRLTPPEPAQQSLAF